VEQIHARSWRRATAAPSVPMVEKTRRSRTLRPARRMFRQVQSPRGPRQRSGPDPKSAAHMREHCRGGVRERCRFCRSYQAERDYHLSPPTSWCGGAAPIELGWSKDRVVIFEISGGCSRARRFWRERSAMTVTQLASAVALPGGLRAGAQRDVSRAHPRGHLPDLSDCHASPSSARAAPEFADRPIPARWAGSDPR